MRLIFGITAPRNHVLGTELAGHVESVGTNVTTLHVGDRVCAHTGAQLRAHAEYVVLRASQCVLLPDKATYREAGALAFGGTTALYFLREAAKLAPGERLLVVGASGCVGSAAVQIGRALGAHVTGVCGPSNLQLVRETLGADAVLDYTAGPLTGNYDVIVDCIGVGGLALYRPLLGVASDNKEVAAKPARLVLIAASLWEMLSGMWAGKGIKVIAGPAMDSPLLADVVEMYANGTFMPLLDERVFTLDDIAKAHALVDTGHKRGSVVVEVVKGAE